MSAPLKAALVHAREQLLQRAHVHIPLELVAGEPHAEPVNLVLRGVLVDLLLAVVLQRALEGERLDAPEARGVQVLHVRLKRLEERVVDEPVLLLLLLLLLSLLLSLLLALLPLPIWRWRLLRLGQEGAQVGVLARALSAAGPGALQAHRAARAIFGVALQWHGNAGCVLVS
jgi:hypothetical protein